ncbi:MAG: fructose-6-phosphate aldolase [Ruminococcaceae bacterium]|nr:fructose-6-phosphate aldolase [Oscillospiraceae bacterium]
MQYLVDTANLEAIRHCCKYYPITGVTTNPTIIAKENRDFRELICGIREIIGLKRALHVQTTAETAEDILAEATMLKSLVGGQFFIKIPITAEGLRAAAMCKENDIGVTMTAIFTQQQALIASVAGADYVAPYVNRLDNIVSDGVNVVSEIVDIFNIYKLPTKVLAASFKTVEQVHKCAMVGTHSITINPDLFESLIFHPLTNTAINSFSNDWEKVYGEQNVPELLK